MHLDMVTRMPGALDGLRVLDLSWGMAGPLGAMLLADNGAEVLKVEEPGGRLRREPGSLVWERGKRSIALDPRDPVGHGTLRRLAERADVVLESGPEGLLAAGLDYQQLAAANPGVVWCSVSAFGAGGPWKELWGDDGAVHARAGSMAGQVGFRTSGPVYVAAPIGSYGAACLAVQGIAAALHVRSRTGRGQRVETSLLQGLLTYRIGAFEAERNGQAFVNPTFEARDPLGAVPFYNLNQCADGVWIQLGCQNPAFARKALVALGLGEMLQDPKWAGVPRRFQDDAHRVELMELVRSRMAAKQSAEWMEIFHKMDVPAAPVLTTEQFMVHPQVQANDLVVSLTDFARGPTRQIGLLANFSETRGAVRGPAPRPGQHTEEVRAELDGRRSGPWSPPSLAPPTAVSPAPRYALEDVRVLDCSAFLAGPVAGKLLADLGCDVIKIEPPEGDNFRLMPAAFIGANRGKRGVVLDLKSPPDREAFFRLAASADVVHQNFRPGVAERLGIDYETLRKLNPRLIYSHSTAFGPRGKDALRPAYDPVVSALCGIMHAQGGAGNPPAHFQISDLSTGLAAATAVCVALVARDRTGAGQRAETSMIASAGYVNSEWFMDYVGRPPRRLPDREQCGLNPIYRLYNAASGWLFLGCVLPEHWEALVAAGLGATDGFRAAGDPANHALADKIASFLSARPAAEWEERLGAAGVPCSVAHRPLKEALLAGPATLEAGLVVDQDHPVYGKLRQAGLGVWLSETPGRIARPEPALGEHTAEVLRQAEGSVRPTALA